MSSNNISRRQFFKFSGTALAGSLLSTGLGSTVFAKAASRDFGAIKFGVISDAHLDIRGKNGMKMSAQSVNSVKKTVEGLNMEEDLSFVLVTGDLLLDGEKENAAQIKALLDTLEYPYFVIAGNHDYMPADPQKRRDNFSYLTIDDFVKTFKGHGYDNAMKRYYARQIKPGLRIIGLDACLPEEPKKWVGVLPE
jgi:3',5'-cyclic AMP phosphodiesterase CpdA